MRTILIAPRPGRPRAHGWPSCATWRRLTAGVAVAAMMLAGCSAGDRGGSDVPLVVASFYPIAEAASRAGAGLVEVVNLTPPGVEPHDLELTPEQIEQIEEAALVLFVGGGFQPAVQDAVASTGANGVDVLERLPLLEGSDDDSEGASAPEEGEGGPDEQGHEDPHVWLDPARWARAVGTIGGAIADVVSDGADAVGEATEAYRLEIQALDATFEDGLADCDRRAIVTSHAAFGYLADRYGLEQEAVAGISAEAEPQPDRLAELADLVRREGVTTIFTETLASARVAETLAREAGVRTAVLDPIEGLTPDQEDAGATYRSVMLQNLDALRAALGCG